MDKNGTKDDIRGSDEFVIRENDDRDCTDREASTVLAKVITLCVPRRARSRPSDASDDSHIPEGDGVSQNAREGPCCGCGCDDDDRDCQDPCGDDDGREHAPRPSAEIWRICTCTRYMTICEAVIELCRELSSLDLQDVVGRDAWKETRDAAVELCGTLVAQLDPVSKAVDDLDIWRRDGDKADTPAGDGSDDTSEGEERDGRLRPRYRAVPDRRGALQADRRSRDHRLRACRIGVLAHHRHAQRPLHHDPALPRHPRHRRRPHRRRDP
nr:MAG TPA: hypothetical protein [Caudoviricetes sp.]